MSDGPNVGMVLLGIFVILFGLCITLVGGGCTLFLLATLGQAIGGGGDFIPFLLISLMVFGIGSLILWVGIKLVRGGYRN